MHFSFPAGLLGALLFLTAWADSCCEIMDAKLPGKVYSPGSTTYSSLNSQRWSGVSVLAPGCIVAPDSTADVSVAIIALGTNNCTFAIKSGGHTAFPGANNIDNGISLDLSALNDVILAADNQTVHLGAGGTWQHVYDTLPSDIVVPGGECGGTGVAGVTLGGGMSLFLAAVGWVADSVRNFEVVLASGEVVEANATSNADLFAALKGGSSNFGVVTHIDLETIPAAPGAVPGAMYVGMTTSSTSANVTEVVLGNLVDFVAANNDDVLASAQILYNMGSTAGDSTVQVIMTHNDGVSVPLIEKSLNITPVLGSLTGVLDMSAMAQEATALYPDGYRDLAATYTFANDLATALAVQQVTEALNNKLQETVADLEWIFSYTPLPAIATQQSLNRGGDQLGLERNTRDLIVLFLSPRWLDAQYDAIMYNATQTWVQQVEAVAQKLGTDEDFLYLNFASGFQNPLRSYGNASLAFMRDVAKKYDPSGLFQKLVPGGFKIDNA